MSTALMRWTGFKISSTPGRARPESRRCLPTLEVLVFHFNYRWQTQSVSLAYFLHSQPGPSRALHRPSFI